MSRRWLGAVLLLGLGLLTPATSRAADIGSVGAQLRLTQIGPDGNTAFFARNPTVAYNSLDDDFLVAWVGRDPLFPGQDEIYGQVLDGTGSPKGPVRRLSVVAGTTRPQQPVLGYSPGVNQYLLAYTGPPPDPPSIPPNNPAGQREVLAQVVTATGVPSGNPVRISNTDDGDVDADAASDPAVAYDPERDQFRLVWVADDAVEGDFEVQSRRVSSSLIDPDNFSVIGVSNVVAGDADEPVIAYLPAQDRYAIAWEGITAGGSEIVAEIIGIGGGVPVINDVAISAGSGSAFKPAITASPGANEVLVSFLRNDVAGEGPEAFVQRLSAAGVQVPNVTDKQISTMGPPNNLAFGANPLRGTTATYHPLLDRYLVTWTADNDFPGLVDNEFERYGQALDAAGNEVGSDDFRISTAGPDGNASANAEDGGVAASTVRRAWLSTWTGDDNRPPLADNEFEIYGRLAGDDGDLDGFVVPADCDDGNAAIRPGAVDIADNGIDEDCSGADTENLDRDGDGSPRPADCNDGASGIRPGAADIPDNGIDEDCSGADAVNLDRDGDGSLRPGDCDDAKAAIRPGAVDVPRNGVDEDCSGADARFPTLTSGVLNSWDVRGTRFTLTVLQVTQQFPKRWKAEIRCKGSKCPFKTKKLKAGKVKRGASTIISSLSSKQRKFRAGQTVEVWVSAPNFNTKVARFVLKKGKIPRTQPFCVVPGQTKPRKTCN